VFGGCVDVGLEVCEYVVGVGVGGDGCYFELVGEWCEDVE